jgi:hypothetical protein
MLVTGIVIAQNKSAARQFGHSISTNSAREKAKLLRGAMIYTLLGSYRRHGFNPFDYLKDLFTRLPAAKITEIQEFTPAAWAKTKEKVFA